MGPNHGSNGSIWKGNNESFYEPITQRGRAGFLLGLELEKLGADRNYGEKTTFLLQHDTGRSL